MFFFFFFGSGYFFQVIPKMVESALALCHSNADVERSLSTNKRMLTKNSTTRNSERTKSNQMCN